MRDLVDQTGSHLAGGPVDAGRAGLARLRDHLPRAGVQVALDLLHPHVRSHDEVHVLAAHLGEHRELLREPPDQVMLDLGVDRDRPVGDLHVAQAQLAQPLDQTLDAPLPDGELGERAAEHHRNLARGVPRELLAQVGAHERRAPAKLDDVHARPRHLQQVVHLRDGQPAVDHVRQPAGARLG